MNPQSHHALIAFGLVCALCFSAAATAVLPDGSARASDLGIVDIIAVTWCQP